MSLAAARLYLVSTAHIDAGSIAELMPEFAAAGVDVFQLREKEMEDRDVLSAAAPILAACRTAGVPFVLNDRPDLARELDADGVHLGQEDMSLEKARAIFSGLVGLSTHSEDQVDGAVAVAPEYIAVGPVNETPTKPGRPGTGLGLVRYAADRIGGIPWFVTGGMSAETLPGVLEAGGRRIVVVRAITEAPDPVKAAAELRSRLDSVPL